MNKIWSIIKKDFLFRFSSRSELLFFLLLPVLFTFMLSGGASAGGDMASIPVLVVDEDASPLSAEVLASLEAMSAIQPVLVSRVEADRRYAERQAMTWLTIPAGFESRLLTGQDGMLELRKAPNSNDADAAERAILSAISRSNRILEAAFARTGGDNTSQAALAQAVAEVQVTLEAAPSQVQVTHPETFNTRSYDPAVSASVGQMITWVFIPLLGISALFALERQQKTLQRVLTTPTSKAVLLAGTIGGQVLTALVQMLILAAFGALFLNVQWWRSPAALLTLMVSFAAAAVALGTMLGTFIKSEKQANNLSIMLGMVMGLLGGCWWPLELFPEAIRTAALVLPTTWAMQGLTGLVLRGLQFNDVLPHAAALWGMAALFFMVGITRFRYE